MGVAEDGIGGIIGKQQRLDMRVPVSVTLTTTASQCGCVCVCVLVYT